VLDIQPKAQYPFAYINEPQNLTHPTPLPPAAARSPSWLPLCISRRRTPDLALGTEEAEDGARRAEEASEQRLHHRCALTPALDGSGPRRRGAGDGMLLAVVCGEG
jgi:hypothetical protein